MAVTYGLAGSSPFSDFALDIENLVIAYIYLKWSIADPAKPAAPHGEGQNIEFRPGFDRGTPSYQILCIQTDTEVMNADTSERSWKFKTRLEITVITNIMDDIDNVKPQLGYMEREVQRILNQYRYGDITSVDRLRFTGQARIYDDLISGGTGNNQIRGSRGSTRSTSADWATSRWKTRIFAECEYWKDDISG